MSIGALMLPVRSKLLFLLSAAPIDAMDCENGPALPEVCR